jgi:hypothetical protein
VLGAGGGQPRRMRGFLVTPWFAAGAGFVIAAGLALNSPHTVLTYRPNTQPCVGHCQPSQPSTSSSPLAVQPGVPIKTTQPAKPRPRHHRARTVPPGAPATGPVVSFKVKWHKFGRFAAIITVPPRQARRDWSLAFNLPHAQIMQVWGARWQPAPGGHGGLAIVRAHQKGPGSSGQAGSPGGGDGQQGGGSQPNWAQLFGASGQRGWWPDGAGFVVIARGRPETPVSCELNKVDCHFR